MAASASNFLERQTLKSILRCKASLSTYSSWKKERRLTEVTYQSDVRSRNDKTKSDFASVYVHWPYCKKRCTYCNFNKYTDSEVDHWRMQKCLVEETKTLVSLAGVRGVSSIFFGGGTPSLAQPTAISAMLNTINSLVGSQDHREVTLEVNPTGFETDKLREFKLNGVNRVSIGIQTLDTSGLSVLGREHTALDSLRCLETARNLFGSHVSIDLIFGWPGQTLDKWLDELTLILPLCDNHVSLYQLTLERGTHLYRLVEKGLLKIVDEDEKDDMYLQALEVLSKHGFERYEVSNFAKQNSYCRHNISYWSGHQYIGIGPGAHGRFKPVSKPLREARIQTLEPKNWMYEVEEFGHATRLTRTLTALEQLEELLISGLRTKWGVNNKAWSLILPGFALPDVLMKSPNIMLHVEEGLLIIDSKSIRATDKGINILDSILPDILCALKESPDG